MSPRTRGSREEVLDDTPETLSVSELLGFRLFFFIKVSPLHELPAGNYLLKLQLLQKEHSPHYSPTPIRDLQKTVHAAIRNYTKSR
jgi:hypothetical protein